MQFLIVVALIAVAISGLPNAWGQSCSCPDGWTRFNTDCYQYFCTLKTWQEAQNSCEAHGANLVSIHSDCENAFAYDLIDSCSPQIDYGFAWIGYYQPSSDFEWSDDSPTGYTYWASGQPDNYNHGYATEDCGHFRNEPEGSWNDFPCNRELGYICKKAI
nr:LOW QUALITY PROTEIN: perlucin-like protein [Lytechinus pictus]XP_054756843.1 perlucin-like protein [Lytechinus pictus]